MRDCGCGARSVSSVKLCMQFGLDDARHCPAVVSHGTLPIAWPGGRARLAQWARVQTASADPVQVTVQTSHPHLFRTPPSVEVGDGALLFSLRQTPDVQSSCYVTCVSLQLTWRLGQARGVTNTTLRIHRDPCGAATSCRSAFFASMFQCTVGTEWAQTFSRFDGKLAWGASRGIAFLGGAARAPALDDRGEKYVCSQKDWKGGEPTDEALRCNSAWGAPTAPDGRPKLMGSESFLPVNTSGSVGQHEFQVAWFAVQDSGFVERPCWGALRKAWPTECARTGNSLEALQAEHLSVTQGPPEMCHQSTSTTPARRRPASLAFAAFAYFLQVYAGRKKGRSRGGKDDYYIHLPDVAAFEDQLSQALEWLLVHHVRLNISVAAVSVLTYERFDMDPVRSSRVESALGRLSHAGVMVLANGGNCRPHYKNCSGLPWPALVPGVVAVGAATMHHEYGKVRRVRGRPPATFSSLDSNDCATLRLAICGARVTSSALSVFSAGVLLVREAIDRNGFRWQDLGPTIPEAILVIIRITGVKLFPNRKANRCRENRICLRIEHALAYVERAHGNSTSANEYQPVPWNTPRKLPKLPMVPNDPFLTPWPF